MPDDFVLFLMVLLVVLVLTDALILFPMFNLRVSAKWPKVYGKVQSTEIGKTTQMIGGSNKGHRLETEVFFPLIRYKYAVGGVDYTSDKFTRVMYSKYSTRKDVQKILDNYIIGAMVEVHYNPSNPKDCAIMTETKKSHYFEMITVSVLIVAILVAIIMLW